MSDRPELLPLHEALAAFMVAVPDDAGAGSIGRARSAIDAARELRERVMPADPETK